VDPSKLWVGNLSYTVTEESLLEFLRAQGIEGQRLVGAKIIHDWRTRKSKGYGFVQFTDPVYATSALEFARGKKLDGRVVRLEQGKKKEKEGIVVVVEDNTREEDDDEEEGVLREALERANKGEDWKEEDFEAFVEGFDDGDGDEDEYDGVYDETVEYIGEVDASLNREKRREQEKNRKKKKKPSTGFGN